jgi:hypothetical protein
MAPQNTCEPNNRGVTVCWTMRLDPETTPQPSAELVALHLNNSDATCRALDVALCAVQLSIAWHSGVISGNTAMAAHAQEIIRVSPRLRDRFGET